MKKLLVLAAIVYFFLAPITFHSDNKAVMQWISNDYWRVWNIYDHTQKVFGDGFVFHYPPMNFWLAKLEWPIAWLIGGDGYYSWLQKDTEIAVYDANIYRYNLATKTPLILITLLIGWLIYNLVFKQTSQKNRAVMAALLWFFNPITLYSVPIMGQNDIFAILFFLAGWYLLDKKVWLSIVLFGLSISVKSYPILWIAFLIFSIPKWSLKQKFVTVIASTFVYLVTIIPYLPSKVFREHALNASISERFYIASIDLGFDEAITIVPLVIMIYFYLTIRRSASLTANSGDQSFYIMVATLLFFSMAHFHPQWYLGVVPFWIVWLSHQHSITEIKKIILYSIPFILAWFAIIFLYKDKFLTIGLFTPLNAHLVNLPVIFDLAAKLGLNPSRYVNLAHTALMSISLFLMSTKKTGDDSKLLALPKFQLQHHATLLLFPTTALATFFLVASAIPTVISYSTPDKPNYVKPPLSVSTPFIAQENFLKRIDIPMKNAGLKSQDLLMFNLYQDENLIYTLPFSAFNAGDTSVVPFGFTPIPDSKGKKYKISITKQTESEVPLMYGLKSSLDSNSLVFHQIYSWTFNPKYFVNSAINRFVSLISQLPAWFISIHLGILYLVIRKDHEKLF